MKFTRALLPNEIQKLNQVDLLSYFEYCVQETARENPYIEGFVDISSLRELILVEMKSKEIKHHIRFTFPNSSRLDGTYKDVMTEFSSIITLETYENKHDSYDKTIWEEYENWEEKKYIVEVGLSDEEFILVMSSPFRNKIEVIIKEQELIHK